MTMITDFILFVLACGFTYKLYSFKDKRLADYWMSAFVFLGLSALLGGLHHGLANIWSFTFHQASWRLTLYGVGAASLFLAIATTELLPIRFRSTLRVLLFIKFAIYIWVTSAHPQFFVVIVDYFPVLLFLLATSMVRYFQTKERGDKFLIFGVLLSFLGAAVQVLKIAPSSIFNHNDLYHCIQMVALYFWFVGASDLCNPTSPAA